MLPFEIYALGDRGLTVSFANKIDEQVNEICVAFSEQLKSLQLTGIKDVIPAYSTVSVYYDPLVIKKLSGVESAQAALIHKLKSLLQNTKAETSTKVNRRVTVPVCYHPSLGFDLESLAQEKSLSADEVIALHTQRTYRVYMLGFLPGFPYMGTVDDKIAAPRKKQPQLIRAGSVGIAGLQTGIYPSDSPGGWKIIGQTPVQLFDPGSTMLTYFKPGDEVTFQAISLEVFHQMQSQQ